MDSVPFNDSINGTTSAPLKVDQNDAGFTSCSKQLDVKGIKLSLRMLHMNAASMVFISQQGKECLNEMGMAFPGKDTNLLPSSTTLFGPEYASNSQRLADLWSKRYKRQFIVSSNIQTNDIDGSLVEKTISEWVRANSE